MTTSTVIRRRPRAADVPPKFAVEIETACRHWRAHDSYAPHTIGRYRANLLHFAAWAAEGLHQLPDVIAAGQNVTPDDVERLAGPVTDELRAARESLANAIGNVDILLKLLDTIAECVV